MAAMDTVALLDLLVSFMTFTLAVYPNRIDYVDAILRGALSLLARTLVDDAGQTRVLVGDGVDSIVELLAAPLRSLSLQVLELDNYPHLMRFLSFATRKQVAMSMVHAVLETNRPIEDVAALQRFLQFISPVCMDDKEAQATDFTAQEFITQQQTVSKLVYFLNGPNLDITMQLLTVARNFFGQGGPRRLVHTLQPVIYRALGLVPDVQSYEERAAAEELPPLEVKAKKLFQFAHKTVSALASCGANEFPGSSELVFRLWLHSAKVAATAEQRQGGGQLEPIVAEFLTQALIVFEEELTDSKQQSDGIVQFVASLRNITVLEAENYDNFSMKITQHANRLLKKPTQCRAIYTCAQLFHCPAKQDGRRVLECLQRALKLADACISTSAENVPLVIEVLQQYIYFHETELSDVTEDFLSNLLQLAQEHVTYEANPKTQMLFRNTLRHVATVKQGGRQYSRVDLAPYQASM